MHKIHTKWGFGMAPEKSKMHEERLRAVVQVLSIINNGETTYSPWKGDCLSMVKGMFTRILKQDQWDWFIVMCSLGLPSKRISSKISKTLGELRKSLKEEDAISAIEQIEILRRCGLEEKLNCYISGENTFPGGCVYILSTRELPNILKIGYTTRNPIERVKEINRSTGVVIPFGVRAAWNVPNPDKFEQKIHEKLNQYRVRADREFFQLDFNKAFSIINDLLNKSIE